MNFLTVSSLNRKCWVGTAIIKVIPPHSPGHVYCLRVCKSKQWLPVCSQPRKH